MRKKLVFSNFSTRINIILPKNSRLWSSSNILKSIFFQNFLCLGSIQKEYKNNKMWFWFLKYWNKKKIIFWTHFDQIQMQFLLHNPLTFRIPCNFLMKLPHLIPRQNLHIIAGHKYLIKCFNVPHLSQIKHIEKLHLLPSVIKKWKAW